MLDEDEPRDLTGGEPVDQERRIRREIANSNERRRMQSINAGFQSLRTLLPHHEGEKLSKAAILQQTAEYIYTLEQEKTRLLSQNSQLKRLLSLSQQRLEGQNDDTSPRMKKKRPAPGTTTLDATASTIELKHEEEGFVPDLNLQLVQEQRLRLKLEERLKSLEHQLSPAPPHPVSAQPPLQATTVTLAATPATLLPTQPLKMEVVKEESSLAHRGLLTTATPATVQAPPGSILVASKDGGVRVETVETTATTSTAPPVPNLPTVPASVEEAKKHQMKQQQEELNRQQQQQQQQKHQVVVENNSKQQANTVATVVAPPPTQQPPSSAQARTYIVNTSSSRQNLDSIVEAIRHLEGDHLFNDSSSQQQQVVKEEVVEYTSTAAPVTKVITESQKLPTVPSKIVPAAIPQTLLPQQPHPPSALQKADPSNSIIIVKHCQT